MAFPFIHFFNPTSGAPVGSTPPISSTAVVAAAGYRVDLGIVPGSFTVITNDVVHINISRPLWTLFDGVTPGEMQIEVINVQGKYVPDNLGGFFLGKLRNGLECRVIVFPTSGTGLQLFQGFLDQISLPANDVEGGRVTLNFRDRAREFRHRTINTSLWVNYNISSLFENVLTAAGISLGLQSIDRVSDEVNLGWFQDQTADSVLSDMLAFNFSKGFVGRQGAINVRGRYYDQDASNVQSYDQFLALDYHLTDDAVINDARFESDPRQPNTQVSTLSYITREIPITATTSIAFVLEYLDPATNRSVPAFNMIPPIPFSDYTASIVSGEPTFTDGTNNINVNVEFFGETAVCRLYNTLSVPVYLNKFQLRGQYLPDAPKLQAITISSSSQNVYGRRSFFLSSPLLREQEYLQDYGRYLVDRQKDSIPNIRAVIRNQVTSASLTLDPGSLVSITNSSTKVASLHFVKRLEHDIDMSSGLQHTISMDLERTVLYDFFQLDVAGKGQVDVGNKLAF